MTKLTEGQEKAKRLLTEIVDGWKDIPGAEEALEKEKEEWKEKSSVELFSEKDNYGSIYKTNMRQVLSLLTVCTISRARYQAIEEELIRREAFTSDIQKE